ncbi:MAG: DsbA family oxidoreductase, partial [Candidatus Aquicultor sp.]
DVALQQFGHKDKVEIVLRSYELMPDAPVETEKDMYEAVAEKYGIDYEEAKALGDRAARSAASVGLVYDIDHAHPTNSFDAQRLVHLAAKHGRGSEMIERLYAAHFTEATNIGKPENLKRLAVEVGLDEKEVETMLGGDAYIEDMHADEAEVRKLGIIGVPFFTFGRKHDVYGSQPSEVFLEMLEKAWAER